MALVEKNPSANAGSHRRCEFNPQTSHKLETSCLGKRLICSSDSISCWIGDIHPAPTLLTIPRASFQPHPFLSALHARVQSFWSCPTLCDPRDCSLPDPSVHGILQARILEWVSMSSSFKGSFWPRDQTCVSHLYLHWQALSLPLAPSGKSTCRIHASSKL